MMNEFDLVYDVSKEVGGDLLKAKRLVNSMFKVFTEELAKGEKIKFVDFGEFEVVKRAARKGHNPHTGEIYDIPSKYEAVFRCGKGFKDLLNEEE